MKSLRREKYHLNEVKVKSSDDNDDTDGGVDGNKFISLSKDENGLMSWSWLFVDTENEYENVVKRKGGVSSHTIQVIETSSRKVFTIEESPLKIT